jgi:serine O-acetyltransferase
MLQTDMEAAYNGDPAALSKEEVILAYPFVEAIAVQRMAHQLYLDQVALIPRIMTEWAHGRTGLDLHPGAEIGTHFFVDHCTGTVVGETTRIGNHVRMYQGVGLVARSLAAGQALRGQKRHPTIEDRVTIYAGATIMGGDTVVGTGSTIGANVFLTQSVPPNSLVLAEGTAVKVFAQIRAFGGSRFPDLAGMASIQLERVSKVFHMPGGRCVEAVRDMTFEVGEGELLVLLGPSGSGKTTTLRLIAGLEQPTNGSISINGKIVNEIPPKDRDIAMVFQNHALYPHLTVWQNIAFGLKLRRLPKSEIEQRVRM